MTNKFTVVTGLELCWDFSREPFVRVPQLDGTHYGHSIAVDPFPCHSHDVDLVQAELDRIAALYPLGHDVQIALLSHESTKRTNGECETEWLDWNAPHPKPWAANIRLWGKRIPPHPAMTRHLVVHEYGHAVAQGLADRRTGECRDFYKIYRFVRGLPHEQVNGNSNLWHLSTAEIFADDFRHLVGKCELEFWPHPGVSRPDQVPGLAQWWNARACEARGEV